MKINTLHCPYCGSDLVTTCSIDRYWVNSGELYCHSVKDYDSDAPAQCHACHWKGIRSDLTVGV